jgi:phage shock protein A
MAESVFNRVRRLISGGIEETVDAMERAGGTTVMREAIRQIDRLVDEAKAARGLATSKRLQAVRQKRMYTERLATLQEKAEFAVEQGRDDLAEAALQRQIDFEATILSLDQTELDASEEERGLEEALASLCLRKAQMEEELNAFEAARRDAGMAESQNGSNQLSAERKVERAEAAFNRAMDGAGGVAGVARADAQAHAKVVEIETLQRRSVISERLAALHAKKSA